MCYCSGSVTHMLNNCEIKDMITRYQWLDRTGYVKIHHQQVKYKGDKQTVDIDADVSVSSKKTSGWNVL